MKNSFKQLFFTFLAGGLFVSSFAFKAPANTYEYMTFTTVESIIPGGAGRSRMLTTDEMGVVHVDKINNLYSIVGINFNNITKNDQIISNKLNELSNQGWELVSSNTGVQSSNADNNNGIYCTRYTLKRLK